ncbi:MAG: hypothetical protein GXO26_08215 [Crenarchaeota archaeon]|nr:hypothetical protein [Thermoproteota archaeon]
MSLPDIGVEIDFTVYREGSRVRGRELHRLVDMLAGEGYCISIEGGPSPRLEVKLCKPVKDVRQIVNYFDSIIRRLRDMGYSVDLSRGRTHITLDYLVDHEPCFGGSFMRKYLNLVLLLDNFDRKVTSISALSRSNRPIIPLESRIMFLIEGMRNNVELVKERGCNYWLVLDRELLELLARGEVSIEG